MNARQPHQRGQALVLAIFFAGVSGLALVVLYNMGQTIHARARLTHAADAAAYTGALTQARPLNLLAYINRAQVGHQVAMAHLVTMGSWAQFGNAQAQQAGRGNPPVSLISMFLGWDAGQAYASARTSADALKRLGQAYAEHDRVVHQVLQKASLAAMHELPQVRNQVITGVLKANFPEQQEPRWQSQTVAQGQTPLGVAMLADTLPGYLQLYAGNGQRGFRPLVESAAAVYPFLDERNATRRNAWPVSKYCVWRRHELRRRGGTWLSQDGNWSSNDTFSFHALRSNRWIGCYHREYSMGWGLTQDMAATLPADFDYTDNPPPNFSNQDFWRWVQASTLWNIFSGASNPLANSYAKAGAVQWASGGLPTYPDIPLARTQQPLRFAIALRQSAATVTTTDAASEVRAPQGFFRYLGLSADEAIHVSSAAETFFVRPQARKDGRAEFANLFRPYWQARRVAVLPQEQVQARRLP